MFHVNLSQEVVLSVVNMGKTLRNLFQDVTLHKVDCREFEINCKDAKICNIVHS